MKWTVKTIALIGLMVFAPILLDAERVNMQVTITAGTPVRLTTTKTLVNRLFIQLKTGSSGRAFLLLGVPATTTCDATNAAQLTAELAPATATAPGGSFSDPQGANGMSPSDSEDLAQICIDGSHTGDVVVISFWRRI